MKTLSLCITTPLLVLIFVLAGSCQGQRSLTKKVKNIEVNDVFSKVYAATQGAILAAKGDSLKVESIDLTFATTVASSIDAGVKLWVLSGNYSRGSSNSKSVTFSFGEDKEGTKAARDDKQIAKFKEYLIEVIKASRSVEAIGKFGLQEFEVSVDFTISNGGGGGAEIEILPVTPSISADREKEISHNITVKFKKVSSVSNAQAAKKPGQATSEAGQGN